MDLLGALIPSAISAVGSFFGGERRNKSQTEAAREQMAFQERMSSTAHQREVTDLRAAGLNPILSAKLGGSSSPAGAQPNIVDSIGEGARSGASTFTANRLMAAQEEQIRAGTEKLMQDTRTSSAQAALLDEQRNLTSLQGKKAFLEIPFVSELAQSTAAGATQTTKNLAVQWSKLSEEHKNWVIRNIADQLGLSVSAAHAAKADIDKGYFNSEIGRALRLWELGAGAAATPLPFIDRR